MRILTEWQVIMSWRILLGLTDDLPKESKVRRACGEAVFINVGKVFVLRQVTAD